MKRKRVRRPLVESSHLTAARYAALLEIAAKRTKAIPPGTRFGALVVVEMARSHGSGALWRVKCDCGSVRVARGCLLRSGHTKSCGCRGTFRWSRDDVSYFEQCVLSYIGVLTPRMPHEIITLVRGDYGTTTDRRVFRHLANLRDACLIVRRPDGYVRSRLKQAAIRAHERLAA